jgi:hypothetical protein
MVVVAGEEEVSWGRLYMRKDDDVMTHRPDSDVVIPSQVRQSTTVDTSSKAFYLKIRCIHSSAEPF